MKKMNIFLMILAPIVGFGQSSNPKIKALWESIVKKEQGYEVKSLAPEVKEVLDLSRKEKDYPSVLKALFYQAKIDIATKDDSEFNVNEVFQVFEKERKTATGVYAAMLDAYQGQLYAIYKSENSYKFRNRTEQETDSATDVRFMTLSQLEQRIDNFYSSALTLLKKNSTVLVKDWKDMFVYDKDSKVDFSNYTLYEAVRLDYASVLLNGLYGFVPQAEQDLNRDKAYKLIDEVKREVANRKNVDLVIYTALFELDFRYDWTATAKNDKYKQLLKDYPLNLDLSKAYLQFLYRQFEQTSENSEFKVEGTEVIAYAQKALRLFSLSADKGQLKMFTDYQKLVTNPDLSVSTIQMLDVNETAPLNISYKNTDKVYVQVVKITEPVADYVFKYDVHEKEGYQYISTKDKVVDSYTIDVKKYDDYKVHSTRIALKPLTMGRYAIMTSTAPFDRLEKDKDVVSYTEVSVSANVIILGENKLRAYNRTTGEPLVNKRIRVSNSISNKRDKNYWETVITTDSKGEHTLALDMQSSQRIYSIDGEDVFYRNYYYNPRKDKYSDDVESISSKLFTDRGIYRPGQTVYFKAILTEIKGLTEKVSTNVKYTVELVNTNNEVINSIDAISNEFGSLQGAFALPASGKLGNFYIRVKGIGGSKMFKVEEYKRPKFEVTMDRVTESFQLNEKVSVKGSAVAFSGANIDKAKVTYKVTRATLWPYLPWYRRMFMRYEKPELITQGETITDKDGKFVIDFTAIPANEKKDKDNPRTYRYVVNVEVTDVNGETHTESSSVTVGDRGVLLDLKVGANVTATDLETIKLNTTNLNGVDYSAKGEVAIYELKAPYPKRMLNTGLRSGNKEEAYTYDEFVKLFPYLPYAQELDQATWKEGAQVFKASFDTAQAKELNWKDAAKLASGTYIVKGFVYDKDGEKVSVDKQVTVVNTNEKNRQVYDLLDVQGGDGVYKVGDKVTYSLQSGEENTIVVVSVISKESVVTQKTLKVGKKAVKFEVPIKDENTISVYFSAVKHNFYQNDRRLISVNNEIGKLNIEVGSFRDKLAPGQKETWTLTISGLDKDKVLSEVLAGMYDASLDEFASNSFASSFYKRKKYYTNNDRFNFNNAFNNITYTSNAVGNYFSYESVYFGMPITLETFNIGFANTQRMMYRTMAKSADANYVMGESAVMAAPSTQKVRGKSEMSFGSGDANNSPLQIIDGVVAEEGAEVDRKNIVEMKVLSPEEATALYGVRGANGAVLITTKEGALAELGNVETRTNLNETAFFYPQLKTDKEGNIKLEFTMPEALTQWKFMALAHSKDLRTGYIEKKVRTQKDLMVVPNMPRFLRQGDEVVISNKTTNLSDMEVNGTVALLLFDAFTMEPIDASFVNDDKVKAIAIGKGESTVSTWTIKVPNGIQAVVYRVVAKAGDFSDGEESALPILSNRMMVTETMPIYVKEGQNKFFTLDKLKEGNSSTSDNFLLTFEMTTNPLWNAVFALPSLREYHSSNANGMFNKFYGNVVSTSIMNSNPRIKSVFDNWNSKGELVSRLEKNKELRNILIEETPWLMQAESEEEQMKRIALLFDLNKMQQERTESFDKLLEMQNADGGFPWFSGSNSNLYITQSIVEGFGNLKKMGMLNEEMGVAYKGMLDRAIQFVDQEQFKAYAKIKKTAVVDYNPINLHYLYVRSFFKDDFKMKEEYGVMLNYYLKNLEDSKLNVGLYSKAMRAVVAKRYGKNQLANTAIKSIMELSVDSDEMGMYWKENKPGWFWYDSPVETQVMIMEAYSEVVSKEDKALEEMKVWLLKNKQTTAWNSTKATTRAIYALLNIGKSWADSDKGIAVKVGGTPIDLTKDSQMGSGYVKQSWSKGEITPQLATVEVEKTSPGVAWGAMYWQYFDDLDKITAAHTGVKFNKQLFLRVNTDKGEVLRQITTDTPIKVGDKVAVRLEIVVDRDMDFVHIKDMRASGFEPTNVFSGYRWRGEFGYYEETRDASTNFFISRLNKGSYVFEYDLRANTAGFFSNGITTLQNMYAPEMSAHSEGIKVEIK